MAALTDQMIRNIPGMNDETFTTITTDYAANMRKAMRESLTVDTHLRCVDHIINTCVTKALEEDCSQSGHTEVQGSSLSHTHIFPQNRETVRNCDCQWR